MAYRPQSLSRGAVPSRKAGIMRLPRPSTHSPQLAPKALTASSFCCSASPAARMATSSALISSALRPSALSSLVLSAARAAILWRVRARLAPASARRESLRRFSLSCRCQIATAGARSVTARRWMSHDSQVTPHLGVCLCHRVFGSTGTMWEVCTTEDIAIEGTSHQAATWYQHGIPDAERAARQGLTLGVRPRRTPARPPVSRR